MREAKIDKPPAECRERRWIIKKRRLLYFRFYSDTRRNSDSSVRRHDVEGLVVICEFDRWNSVHPPRGRVETRAGKGGRERSEDGSSSFRVDDGGNARSGASLEQKSHDWGRSIPRCRFSDCSNFDERCLAFPHHWSSRLYQPPRISSDLFSCDRRWKEDRAFFQILCLFFFLIISKDKIWLRCKKCFIMRIFFSFVSVMRDPLE